MGSVRFRFLHNFLGFGFVSVLGKTRVLVRFVVAGFGYFPISTFSVCLSFYLSVSLPVSVCVLSQRKTVAPSAVFRVRQHSQLRGGGSRSGVELARDRKGVGKCC